MTRNGQRSRRLSAICPIHGPVEAISWNGALVCPEDACHRTCADDLLQRLANSIPAIPAKKEGV